jgi:Arc/MetJ-type ribon-helix-helix transcriptional regulator
MPTTTINLPTQMRKKANLFIEDGFYISLGDMIRSALRLLMEKDNDDLLLAQAKNDLKKGRGVMLKTDKEIDRHFKSL